MSDGVSRRLAWGGVDRFAATLLVQFAFGFSLYLFGGAVDQPHPLYADGRSWLALRLGPAIGFGALLAVVVAILIPIDLIAQRKRGAGPPDWAYFLRLTGLRHSLSVMPTRLVLVACLLLLAGWWLHTQLQLWLAEFGGGMVWPPERVVAGGAMLWSLLWLVDRLTRPRGGTAVAAGCFLLLAVICAWLIDGNIIRECWPRSLSSAWDAANANKAASAR